ncbi:glycosyltransferase [Novosphingobium cyanobacteriorum]|uniref:Glycosyltransferase n=1 Tax=Novosphingobium cyanobacteriorum TaxID=3024215 RepID=A0ABT6CMG5_9SPHN|nr:glycosyltransferase [Novosphingobium cyanobacteriorum]MDF8334996.1 glycosyltransferase [Novosphingobium cyanobacteriorum]
MDTSYGGPAVSVPSLALAMKPLGFDPIFVSVDRSDARNSLIEKANEPWFKALPAGTPIGYGSFELAGLLDKVISDSGAGIVHVHSVWGHPTIAAHRAARRRSIPLVISPRSELYAESLKKSRMLKSVFMTCFIRGVLRYASLLHATDQKELEALGQFVGLDRVALVPNGVDLTLGAMLESAPDAKRRLGIDPDVRVILFLSRLHPRKNPEGVIRAWLTAGLAHRGWNLIMAGQPEEASYQRELEALVPVEFKSSVHWLGHVAGERKRSAFAAADIFCLPSFFENFGIAIAEALACSVPVVTTEETPWQELREKDAGRLVASNDINALACTLEELAGMPEAELGLIGERGRAIVEKYTWGSAGQSMADAYARIQTQSAS